ncbi:MAG: TIGR02147 family protein [bacterium]|nr:TIGR02147 family protein [bacterium]
MISIYDFLDYRCFLKDKFSELKKLDSRYSYRFFNRLAGVKSSGFLKLVMDDKRNIASDGIRMIVKGFKLTEDEAKYFESLVKFNQAKDHAEKDRHFRELSRNKRFIRAKPLTAAQYHLFSHWYYVAILELVRLKSCEIKDAHWINQRIKTTGGLREINQAVKELRELDLLGHDENGSLIRRETMLSTPDQVQSLSVANFHRQMSTLAGISVTRDPAQNREFSTLTIATSEKGFEQAKKEIQEFRKKLHSLLEQELTEPRSTVVQVNLQLFKLDRTEET